MRNMMFLMLILANLCLAQDVKNDRPKHLISIDKDSINWSGLSTIFDWDKEKSSVKDSDYSEGHLSLNYSYVLETGLSFGAKLYRGTTETNLKYESGDKETDLSETTSFSFLVGYNFQDDLFNSWWILASIGAGQTKTEEQDTANNIDTDTDISASIISFEVGKRFSLEHFGLKNITYSPSVKVSSVSYGDDADDAGLDSSTGVQLNVIKFDVLF